MTTNSARGKATYIIPLRARVKPSSVDVRARGKSRGYHKASYRRWQSDFKVYLIAGGKPPILTGKVALDCIIRFKLKGPRADADNLAGGIMDACNGVHKGGRARSAPWPPPCCPSTTGRPAESQVNPENCHGERRSVACHTSCSFWPNCDSESP